MGLVPHVRYAIIHLEISETETRETGDVIVTVTDMKASNRVLISKVINHNTIVS
jgi:hypothetical protein